MLKIKNSVKFKEDLKKFSHQQKVLKELNDVLEFLVQEIPLSKKYRDHPLSGNWVGRRECHIKPDILLIYMTDMTDENSLFLERIGSHSELFR